MWCYWYCLKMKYLLLLLVICTAAQQKPEEDDDYYYIGEVFDAPPVHTWHGYEENFTSTELEQIEKLRAPLERGMDLSRRAFIGVCWYFWVRKIANIGRPRSYYENCRDAADYIFNDNARNNRLQYIIGKYVIKNKTEDNGFKMTLDEIESEFGRTCVNDVLGGPCYRKLPEGFQTNCSEYLTYYWEKYPVDEGEVVGEPKEANYPYLGFTYCLIHTLRLSYGEKAVETLKRDLRLFRSGLIGLRKSGFVEAYVKPYMIKMLKKPSDFVLRAHNIVCWYEWHIFSSNPLQYKNCKGKQEQIQDHVFDNAKRPAWTLKPELFDAEFASITYAHLPSILPKVYSDACAKYLIEHPLDNPPADESEIMGVGPEFEIPYRSYAYCLIHTIRKERGEEAISKIVRKISRFKSFVYKLEFLFKNG